MSQPCVAGPIVEWAFLRTGRPHNKEQRQFRSRARTIRGNSMCTTSCVPRCQSVQGQARRLQLGVAHIFLFQLYLGSVAFRIYPSSPIAKPQMLFPEATTFKFGVSNDKS